jgi:hypothetical protein
MFKTVVSTFKTSNKLQILIGFIFSRTRLWVISIYYVIIFVYLFSLNDMRQTVISFDHKNIIYLKNY